MSSHRPWVSIASLMAAKCSRNLSTRSCAGRWPAPVQDRPPWSAIAKAYEAHPAGGVGLLQRAADREVRAVDRADVVQPQEAALEKVVAVGVLAVDPPGEVDQELVEDPAEELDVAAAVDGEDLAAPPRPAPAG